MWYILCTFIHVIDYIVRVCFYGSDMFICSGLVTQNVTVGFERVSYVVSETENILVINIIASGRFDGPIVLLINTTDETGRGMCICMCVQLFYSILFFRK